MKVIEDSIQKLKRDNNQNQRLLGKNYFDIQVCHDFLNQVKNLKISFHLKELNQIYEKMNTEYLKKMKTEKEKNTDNDLYVVAVSRYEMTLMIFYEGNFNLWYRRLQKYGNIKYYSNELKWFLLKHPVIHLKDFLLETYQNIKINL